MQGHTLKIESQRNMQVNHNNWFMK